MSNRREGENPTAISKIATASSPNEIVQLITSQETFKVKPGTLAVLRAAEAIFSGQETLPRKVTFSLGNESYVLIYSISNRSIARYDVRMTIKLAKSYLPPQLDVIFGTGLSSGEIISGELFIYPDDQAKNIAECHSAILTRQGYEDNGFGTGLALLGNIAIQDFIDRGLANQFTTIRSQLTDAAEGVDVKLNRKNWSSSLAKILGYQSLENDKNEITQYPQFQRDFPVKNS